MKKNAHPILFILLALDCAGFFHGDFSGEAAAIIAVILAVLAALVAWDEGRTHA
jgi:hypothetical protein